ncbi:MAG: hypothetical protein CMJ94_13735 [Planctomycetes bacterium]|nr:hypothetical protein [Planctomycetota bacterium]
MATLATVRTARSLQVVGIVTLFAPLLVEWWKLVSEADRVSYTILVPFLAAGLAWRRRSDESMGATADVGPNWPTILLLLLATTVLAVGSLAAIFTLSIAAFPLTIAAWVGATGGVAALRRYAAPLVLFQGMVPPPLPLFDWAVPQLVKASGAAAVGMLKPFDTGASWIGNELTYQEWTLVVAEACSGSGALLIYWVLILFLGGLFRLRVPLTLAFLAFAVPFTLFINGVRIALTALILDLWGRPAVTGVGHEILGQLVVILGAGLLAYLMDVVVQRGKKRSDDGPPAAAKSLGVLA